MSRFTDKSANEEVRDPSLDLVTCIRARRFCWLELILRLKNDEIEDGEKK